MATPLLPKIPGGMGILWPNWVTKVVEELRSHGRGVTKRAYGLRVTSWGSVGSNEVTRSLGHMEVMRPWWSCCHLHGCSGKSGGTPGSRVPQRPTRSRGTLMEETKCKAQPHDPHSLPPPVGSPHHHTLELTGGPGSPFCPGRPGPSPPMTCPGSPCRTENSRQDSEYGNPEVGEAPEVPSYSL